jgi:hypothetical protein
MRRPWWLVLVLGCLIAAAPAGQPDAADLERNRRLLEKWRADPEHARRLQGDLRAFYALPPDRQDQIRRFDRQLHEMDLATQTRLWAVLDRYSVWLEGLPEQQRQEILKAETPGERLNLIRSLRQREWIDRLPAKLRDEVLALPKERREDRVAKLRQEERALRQLWMSPLRPAAPPSVAKGPAPEGPGPKRPGPEKPGVKEPVPPPIAVPVQQRPLKLAEFPAGVREFVEHAIKPRMTPAEKEELVKAEGGRWPDLARTIRRLADNHPVLPPLPSGPITSGLQVQVRASIPAYRAITVATEKKGIRQLKPGLAKLKGKWPEFALAATKIIKLHVRIVPPLGASKPGEFPAEMRPAIRKLTGSLSEEQRKKLHELEGHWPEYPFLLRELARQKDIVIPGMTLPGPRKLWEDALTAGLPDVPGRLLLEFALNELTAEERASLHLSAADPKGSRERLKKAYYLRKPRKNDRTAQADPP